MWSVHRSASASKRAADRCMGAAEREKNGCFRMAIALHSGDDESNGDGRARTADLGFMNPSL